MKYLAVLLALCVLAIALAAALLYWPPILRCFVHGAHGGLNLNPKWSI